MRNKWMGLLLIFYMCFLLVCGTGVKYYTNKWLAHVPLGEEAAKIVAESNDMKYEGPDVDNDGFHIMMKQELPSKMFSHNEDVTNQLNSHKLVTTAFQEAVKERSFRGLVQTRHVVPRHVVPRINNALQPRNAVSGNVRTGSNYEDAFDDERWSEMWYFQDFRKDESEPVLDMNIVPVFYDLKITGKNVNITVPDDGLEWTHPEILPNFNPYISWNFISNTHNIMPDKDGLGSYKSHGTRCAGEIIMQPNNGICGVGTAYGASIGGIKFLDDKSTDAREAKVLKYALRYVSIYSNSWGPADTGTFMEHLTSLVKRAMSKGIHQGRDGKGAIYVFAAGNGKAEGDNCACDGFVNSIYTVVIASCDDSGHVTHYSERCASVIATAYSGSGRTKNVLTTDVEGQCTNKHTGTSAAAPLVSGIIGLALSANPNLTWRDVQHLIVWTSQVAPLSDNYGWNRNKAGFLFSVDFGFGLVNALQLVQAAQNWKNVPEMSSCGIRMPSVKGFPVSRNGAARITVHSDGCENLPGEVQYIEYVQLVLTMTYPKRGDIQIAMRSPLGTECHVLESRRKDLNTNGLNRWTFSVLAFWGESPKGNFTIEIFDTTGNSNNSGHILEMTLSIHGTKDQPNVYKNGPRSYDAFKLAKPGDEPRFFHLNSNHVSTPKSQEPSEESYNHISNSQIQIDNELKQRVENSEIINNNIQKFLVNIEKESDIEENAILQKMKPNITNLLRKKYQEDALNAILKDIQNNNELKQQISNPEIINKYLQNFLVKMEQDSINQEDMILHEIKPNIQNLIRRQKIQYPLSNRIRFYF